MKFLIQATKYLRYFILTGKISLEHNKVEKTLLENGKLVFHYGNKEKEKIVYIIDLYNYRSGFCAQLLQILKHLILCENKGYLVSVKMCGSIYSRTNIFDLFFTQPDNIANEETRKYRNVIYSDSCHLDQLNLNEGYNEDEEYNSLLSLARKKISYQPMIEKRLKSDVISILDGNKCLGIHIRGGDYNQNWAGHPKAIRVKDYFEHINAILSEGYEKVFVATDDKRCLKELVQEYSEKIVFYSDVTRTEIDEGIHYQFTGDNLVYEVVRDIYTLSVCHSLVAGLSLVPRCAFIEKMSRNEEYEHKIIINRGINKDKNVQ